jgi:hypothetical protein
MDEGTEANLETGAETGIEAAMQRLAAIEAQTEEEPVGQPETELAAQEELNGSEMEANDETEAESEEGEGAEVEELDKEAPAKYRVKVQGEEKEVSLDELQNGYMRDSDYRQKTMEAARLRQAYEQRQSQLEQKIAGFVPQLEEQLSGEFSDIKTFSDEQRMAAEDPARYVRFQAQREALRQAQATHAQLVQERHNSEQENHRQWVQEQAKQLAVMVPDAMDPEKGAEIREGVKRIALDLGFEKERLAQISAQEFSVLHELNTLRAEKKAWEGKKDIAGKKSAKAPPVQKPGVAKGGDPKAEAAEQAARRLKKHGGIQNAMDVLAARGI